MELRINRVRINCSRPVTATLKDLIATKWFLGGLSLGGVWMVSCQNTKIWINLDLIEIIEFCLKIYALWIHPHLWVGVWVVGWMGGSCQISNWINLDPIEIIQFCLQIYNLSRYLHAHDTHCSQSLVFQNMSLIHCPTVWLFDNCVLCITANFGHSFDILPTTGLFLQHLSYLQWYCPSHSNPIMVFAVSSSLILIKESFVNI